MCRFPRCRSGPWFEHTFERVIRQLTAARRAGPGLDTARSPLGYRPAVHANAERVAAALRADVATFEVVWASAGTPHRVFLTNFDELIRLTGGRTADIAAAS